MRELLTSCGGEEFIPMFARKEITFKEIQFMEEKDLKEVTLALLAVKQSGPCFDSYFAFRLE